MARLKRSCSVQFEVVKFEYKVEYDTIRYG